MVEREVLATDMGPETHYGCVHCPTTNLISCQSPQNVSGWTGGVTLFALIRRTAQNFVIHCECKGFSNQMASDLDAAGRYRRRASHKT